MNIPSAATSRLPGGAGLTRWALSISHDGGMAIAFVVVMGRRLPGLRLPGQEDGEDR